MRSKVFDLKLSIPRIKRRARQDPAPGAAPGTLAIAAGLPHAQLRCCVYDPDRIEEAALELGDLEAKLRGAAAGGVTWIDVQGLGDEQTLLQIGAALGLHPLTLEDVVHTQQRPKVEVFDDQLFIVARCVRLLEDGSVDNEQISMVLKRGLLVTFQERPGDGFDPVRRRLHANKGSMRKSGADYLAAALLDLIIDLVFPVLEAYSDTMDRIDEEIATRPGQQAALEVHALKRELRLLRRAIWPLRDAVGALLREEHDLIGDSVRPFLRECHDHAMQAADFIDGARERVSDLGDRYTAIVAERTNEVMKVLTVIATIFIPLTYLAGIFGMNFDTSSPYNMPELGWRFGYLTFWVVNLILVALLLYFFKRQGWLGRSGAAPRDSD